MEFWWVLAWFTLSAAWMERSSGELIQSSQLPLRTLGQEVVDKDGKKVKLACVNWYGVHMEQFVISGLHKLPLKNLTRTVVELGFNCVRLPFSLELVDKDPVVDDSFLVGDPSLVGRGLTGMQLLDITIQEFQANNLIVVLNNHVSKAGWCCSPESDEGFWNTKEYSTESWVDILGQVTRRYQNMSYVAAFDLRNEIHDVGAKKITWGQSDDKDTDWKVASELAGARVLEEDSDMLVIVTGLCFGFELRAMQSNPPVLPVQNRLVWTTHSYGFSTWWNSLEGMTFSYETWLTLAICLAAAGVLLFLALVAFPANRIQLGSVSRNTLLTTALAWLAVYSFLVLAVGIVWLQVVYLSTCAIIAYRPKICIAVGASLLGVSLLALLVVYKRFRGPVNPSTDDEEQSLGRIKDSEGEERGSVCCTSQCKILNGVFVSLFLVVLSAPLFWLALTPDTYERLEGDFAARWQYKDTLAPIWLGEFGASTREDNSWWINLIKFLSENPQISWAYWPFDGQKWSNSTQTWEDETYGILNQDYRTIRNPDLLADLQSVQ